LALEQSQTIAVIGCGNPTRRDDGVGSEVIRALRSGVPEQRVQLLDAGTDGMSVMFAARGCSSLLLIDACRSGSTAGSVFEVPGSELETEHRPSLTLHDFRWDHAIFAGQRMFGSEFPSDITVFLIEAATVDFGIGLSPPVTAAAVKVTSRVESLVRLKLHAPESVSRWV
jgi:hydrogenase maturation protease